MAVFILHACHARARRSYERAGRAGKARRDRVDGNPERTQIARQRARNSDNAGLARHVVRKTAHHRAERARCHVDDASPSPLLHAGHEGSAHEKHAVQVDCQHPPPVRKRHLVKRLIGKDAGAVDEDVAAAKAARDLGRKRFDRILRGDVAGAGERLPAGLLDHPCGIAARRDVGNDNVGAVLGKPLCEGLSDAVRPTRNNRDLAVMGFGRAALSASWMCGERGPGFRSAQSGLHITTRRSLRRSGSRWRRVARSWAAPRPWSRP